jgi:HKD family nuclease
MCLVVDAKVRQIKILCPYYFAKNKMVALVRLFIFLEAKVNCYFEFPSFFFTFLKFFFQNKKIYQILIGKSDKK